MSQHTVQLRFLRMAPRKVRLIADLVRGLPVNEAEARLLLDRHRASQPILKLLRSAMAGAKAKELNLETLYIAEIRVDQGPMLKRWMARAQGRGVQIQKKMSHVMIGLGENPVQKGSRFEIARPSKKKAEPAEKTKRVRKKKEEVKDTKKVADTVKKVTRKVKGDKGGE